MYRGKEIGREKDAFIMKYVEKTVGILQTMRSQEH